MKRIRMAGLCLVAVFVLGAVMAGSASAASPEFKTCVKAVEKLPNKTYKDGEYSDKGCSKAEAGGKYKLAAWNEGKKNFKLTGKGGKGVNIQYIPSSETIIGDTECSSEKISGEVTGAKTAKFTTEYKGCKTNEGKNCNSAGEGKGKIKTNTLEGELVPQPGSKEGVGILVFNEASPGGVLAAYNCEGLEVSAAGAVMGEVDGGSAEAVKEMEYNFAKGPGVFQKWGYLGENEAETYSSFVKFFKGEGPAPSAIILSTIKSAEIGELTLPATQQSSAKVKTEAFKIV
jgi:hypothetical protein